MGNLALYYDVKSFVKTEGKYDSLYRISWKDTDAYGEEIEKNEMVKVLERGKTYIYFSGLGLGAVEVKDTGVKVEFSESVYFESLSKYETVTCNGTVFSYTDIGGGSITGVSREDALSLLETLATECGFTGTLSCLDFNPYYRAFLPHEGENGSFSDWKYPIFKTPEDKDCFIFNGTIFDASVLDNDVLVNSGISSQNGISLTSNWETVELTFTWEESGEEKTETVTGYIMSSSTGDILYAIIENTEIIDPASEGNFYFGLFSGSTTNPEHVDNGYKYVESYRINRETPGAVASVVPGVAYVEETEKVYYNGTEAVDTPLTFEIISGGTIGWEASSRYYYAGNWYSVCAISYSKNGGEWTELVSTTSAATEPSFLEVSAGDVVEFRGYAVANWNHFTASGGCLFNVYGDPSSLYTGTLKRTAVKGVCGTMFSGCTGVVDASGLKLNLANHSYGRAVGYNGGSGIYARMFYGCTSLTTAPELPATTLTDHCYYAMFDGCTSLATAPALPATTLISACYHSMFNGCTSLTTAPELPATTLAGSCYYFMFEGCTNLTTAPELPATTLANYCYCNMFYGCTSLTTAPELPATVMAGSCYESMFKNCKSLTQAPELPSITLSGSCYETMFAGCTNIVTAPTLPATTLPGGCYAGMFSGCTNLTTVPSILPATTLSATSYGSGCCQSMFAGCTSLTKAPELPATTLAYRCYNNMFYGCKSLVKAPELPATTLANECYNNMFYNCSSLNYIKAMFTTTPSTTYTKYWVSGVASSGTFVKNSAATWTTTGSNAVPTGWTVETADA